MTLNPQHSNPPGRIARPRDRRPRMVALPGGAGVPPTGEPPFDCSIPRCSMRIARNLILSFIITTVGGSALLFLITLLAGAS